MAVHGFQTTNPIDLGSHNEEGRDSSRRHLTFRPNALCRATLDGAWRSTPNETPAILPTSDDLNVKKH